MLIKILSAVAATVIGGVIGAAQADKLSESRKNCTEIGEMLHRTVFAIEYRSDDVYAICRRLKADSDLSRLTFLKELPEGYVCGQDFREMWDRAVISQKNLGEDEKEILFRCGGIIGKSDAGGQIAMLGELQEKIRKIEEQRGETALKKGRLYRSAGLLFGIMAGIIVI